MHDGRSKARSWRQSLEERTRNYIKPYRTGRMHFDDEALQIAIHGEHSLCSTIGDIYINLVDPGLLIECRIAMRLAKFLNSALYSALPRNRRRGSVPLPVDRPPISEEDMTPAGLWPMPDGRKTVWSVIYNIYTSTDNVEVRRQCRIAIAMANAMRNRLIEYLKDSTSRLRSEDGTPRYSNLATEYPGVEIEQSVYF